MKIKITVCALLLVLQLSAFTAFDKGKWQADIVLPAKPDQIELFAAKELQYHLGKATGIVPEIVKDGEKSKKSYHFFIGDTSAARKAGIDKNKVEKDRRIIKSVRNGVLFVGGDRPGLKVGNHWSVVCHGTLYAVYEYLEKQLGVRWLWPGELGEIIPAKKKIEIGKMDHTGIEPLIARRVRAAGPDKRYLVGWKELKNRDAYFAAQELFLIRHRMGARKNLYYGHNFDKYWKRFGKTHPEYFSLLPNGKREPLKGDRGGQYITMCVSNPGFQDQVIRDWKAIRRSEAKHYRFYVNACENDTPGMCVCKNCRAWDAKDPRFAASKYWGKGEDPLTRLGRFYRLSRVFWGEDGDKNVKLIYPPSLSDRYSKFYMALLKKAKAVDPKAQVAGYAYANYIEPPRETKLDKDIMLIYVPSIGFPYGKSHSKIYREQWSGWKKSGIRDFVLRPNYTLMGANMPYNVGRIFAEDFAFSAKNGMIGTNFDSLTGVFANQGAFLYTLFRVHRDPGFGYENCMKEYCAAFAPADKEIREYVDFWEDFGKKITTEAVRSAGARNRDRRGSISGGHSNFMLLAYELYKPETFKKAAAILDRASKRASGNKIALKRIDFLRKGLKDAELTCKTAESHRSWLRAREQKKPRPERVKLSSIYQKNFKALVAYRASVEADFICNYSAHAVYESYSGGWPHKRTKLVNTKKK